MRLRSCNTEHMHQAVFVFRRYEDASLAYTGLDLQRASRTVAFEILWSPVRLLNPRCEAARANPVMSRLGRSERGPSSRVLLACLLGSAVIVSASSCRTSGSRLGSADGARERSSMTSVSTTSRAASAVNACDLLHSGEIAEVLGGRFKDGLLRTSEPTACSFHTVDSNFNGVDVFLWKSGAVAHIQALKAVPGYTLVSGLGDEAVARPFMIAVRVGERAIQIDGSPQPSQGQFEALARLALSRL